MRAISIISWLTQPRPRIRRFLLGPSDKEVQLMAYKVRHHYFPEIFP